LDAEWIKQNTSIDITKPIHIEALNNEIIINDVTNNKQYTYFDLPNILSDLEGNKEGTYTRTFLFDDAYIETGDKKIKILNYTVEYLIPKSIEEDFSLDAVNELIGVVEYLGRGIKKQVFIDGKIQNGKLS
jgi:hypothetical protein